MSVSIETWEMSHVRPILPFEFYGVRCHAVLSRGRMRAEVDFGPKGMVALVVFSCLHRL